MRFWTLDRKLFWVAGLVMPAAVLVGAWVFWSATGWWESTGEPGGASGAVTAIPMEGPAPEKSGVQAGPGPATFVPAKTDFFVEYRLEREMSRGRQVELLQSVAQDANADETRRAAAQERLLQITRDLERELGLENILRAKGFRDVVVFFQGDVVTVIVSQPLSEEQTTSIINLVARGAGVLFEDVMVIGYAAESSI
jgi:stage III sporulation protein AH